MKLNVLLAKTDQLSASFKNLIEDYVKFFKNSQGAFKGEKKTYSPRENTIDLPEKRVNKLIVATVPEKLSYLQSETKEYINALFSQEKTNASGVSKAKLSLDGVDFGEFSSLELLRLKSILESSNLKTAYETLPVRNEDEIWVKTNSDSYTQRDVYESTLRQGVEKTTVKETYILQDPNIDKIDGAKYVPQLASKDTVLELGDYTHQRFSGEISHVERAGILSRRSRLLTAVVEALKEANDVDAVESDMTADKLFNFLHTGKL